MNTSLLERVTVADIQAERARRAFTVTAKQQEIDDATERFVDVEGAMRAAKTWGCLRKWRLRLKKYPGISLVMSRWKDEDLWNKLVPDYRKVCEKLGLPAGDWNAREECFEFTNGSRLYAISLKTSELASAQSKPRGFTIAGIYISQLEEVPKDVAREWMMRLSQPGYPHQFLSDANPVHDGHWIAEEWPADNSRPDYRYITASIWDNAANLDPSTIAAAEAMYPLGHPMRPAKLEGKRGANSEGDPVYEGYFDAVRHVDTELEPWPHTPIIAGWDFGAKHPAVVFAQFLPWGAHWSLGAIMGNNVVLEWFAPRVLEIAGEWFPKMPLIHVGDPAGAHRNSQGVTLNAKKVLNGLNINLKTKDDSNDLRVRYACIQTLGGYMLRTCRPFVGEPTGFEQAPYEEPAFILRPRGLIISKKDEKPISLIEQALGGGYVWDDGYHGTGNLANIRRPLKDGFFEHGMNATEYTVHHFAGGRPNQESVDQAMAVAAKEAVVLNRGALVAAQFDHEDDPFGDRAEGLVDPTDVRRRGFRGGRAGY